MFAAMGSMVIWGQFKGSTEAHVAAAEKTLDGVVPKV
ncbi:hypothetical protein LCGC14_3039160, partial [marine sediment metagenome]